MWRILVADDSRDNADGLAELLRLMGHDVATALIKPIDPVGAIALLNLLGQNNSLPA